jgi:hypothetical protein
MPQSFPSPEQLELAAVDSARKPILTDEQRLPIGAAIHWREVTHNLRGRSTANRQCGNRRSDLVELGS